MKVVADAGPLIALSKINRLFLLKDFFGELIIPSAVWEEVVKKGKGRPGAKEVRKSDWIKVIDVKDTLSCEILSRELGRGEAEAVVLAKEIKADLLIIDEKVARSTANALGINITGSLAVLQLAIQRGLVREPLKDIIKEMRQKGIWISDEMLDRL